MESNREVLKVIWIIIQIRQILLQSLRWLSSLHLQLTLWIKYKLTFTACKAALLSDLMPCHSPQGRLQRNGHNAWQFVPSRRGASSPPLESGLGHGTCFDQPNVAEVTCRMNKHPITYWRNINVGQRLAILPVVPKANQHSASWWLPETRVSPVKTRRRTAQLSPAKCPQMGY